MNIHISIPSLNANNHYSLISPPISPRSSPLRALSFDSLTSKEDSDSVSSDDQSYTDLSPLASHELHPTIIQEANFLSPDHNLVKKELEETLKKIEDFQELIPKSVDVIFNSEKKQTIEKSIDELFFSLLKTCLNFGIHFGDFKELEVRLALRQAKILLKEHLLIDCHQVLDSHNTLLTATNEQKLKMAGVKIKHKPKAPESRQDKIEILNTYKDAIQDFRNKVATEGKKYEQSSIISGITASRDYDSLIKKINNIAASVCTIEEPNFEKKKFLPNKKNTQSAQDIDFIFKQVYEKLNTFLRAYIEKTLRPLVEILEPSPSYINETAKIEAYLDRGRKNLSEIHFILSDFRYVIPSRKEKEAIHNKINEMLEVLLNICLHFEIHCGNTQDLQIRAVLKHAKLSLNKILINDFSDLINPIYKEKLDILGIKSVVVYDTKDGPSDLSILLEYKEKIDSIVQAFRDRSEVYMKKFHKEEATYFTNNIGKLIHPKTEDALKDLHKLIENKMHEVRSFNTTPIHSKQFLPIEEQNIKRIYFFLSLYIGHGLIAQNLPAAIISKIRSKIRENIVQAHHSSDISQNLFYTNLQDSCAKEIWTYKTKTFAADLDRAVNGKFITLCEGSQSLLPPFKKKILDSDIKQKSEVDEYINNWLRVYGSKLYANENIFLFLHQICNEIFQEKNLSLNEKYRISSNPFENHEKYYNFFYAVSQGDENQGIIEKIQEKLSQKIGKKIDLLFVLQLMDYNRLIYHSTSQFFLLRPESVMNTANIYTFQKSYLFSSYQDKDDNETKDLKTTFYEDFMTIEFFRATGIGHKDLEIGEFCQVIQTLKLNVPYPNSSKQETSSEIHFYFKKTKDLFISRENEKRIGEALGKLNALIMALNFPPLKEYVL